jgi:hypothetical protein
MSNYITNSPQNSNGSLIPTTNFQRSYAPSNYIQDKYSQYQLNMDTFWPSQITDLPFYNDVYYSSPNSIGTPIFTKPSYDALQNPSFQEPFSIPQQMHQQMPQQLQQQFHQQIPQQLQQQMHQQMPQKLQQQFHQQIPQQPNNMYQQPLYMHNNQYNTQQNSGHFMERDSYVNTMSAQNKDIDYRQFIDVKEKKVKKPKPRKIIYISKNRDYVHTMIIFLLIAILLLNH